jgi:hypothetical protein
MPASAAALTKLDTHRLGLDRLASADASATLERLRGSPLLAEGKVNLIGLDAVRDRLGARWQAKREQVWEQTERCFTRQMGPLAFAVRVSETDYIVAQPQVGRYAAQAGCLSVLKEVLTFFLGDAAPADLRLREVTSLSADGANCRAVDPGSALSAAAKEAGSAPSSKPPVAPEDASPDRWSPFVTGDGRAIRVSSRVDPIFELQQMRMVGHRLEPRLIDLATGEVLTAAATAALSPAERERTDLANIARGVSRLRSTAAGARQPLLILSAAFSTLGATRGRMSLSAALREAKVDANTRIVCEIRELDGAPPALLAEAVALLKPFCYATLGLCGEGRAAIETLAPCGFTGLAMKLFDSSDDRQALLRRMQIFAAQARPGKKVCMAFGLSSPMDLALAQMAGLTHASMRADAPSPAAP